MKDSFLFHRSFYTPIKHLSFAEKGQLLDAVFEYNFTGNILPLPPVLEVAFNFMKERIDWNTMKYKKIVERNTANGKKGGRPSKTKKPKKPTGINGNPEKPKKSLTDTDTDTDYLIYVSFCEFVKSYPGTKRGKQTEWDDFVKKNDPETVKLLKPSLEKQIQHRTQLKNKKGLFLTGKT